MNYLRKVIYGLLYALAIGLLIFVIRSKVSRSIKESDKLALAEAYVLNITPDKAQRYQINSSEKYVVEDKGPEKVQMVCRVVKQIFPKKYATISITFSATHAPPYHGTCVELNERGELERGFVKLTPNVFGGFELVYWTPDGSQYIEGVFHPITN
ncbi:MAG: hypothetical protein RLZZ517_232 [Candidatus Parcubacteria bacterium]|jgi:hypothetical protein